MIESKRCYQIENQAIVIFDYQISSSTPIMHLEKVSNKVVTYYRCMKLEVIETVDKEEACVGEHLYYKVEIVNKGNIALFHTCFVAMPSREICFIPQSLEVKGVKQAHLNPYTGFGLGVIQPYETIEIQFGITVLQIPQNEKVYGQSQLVCSYKIDVDEQTIIDTKYSNLVQTIIKNMACTLVKKVNKTYTQCYDYLAYEIDIYNTGNVELKAVIFQDVLMPALQFVPKTVYIDGILYKDYHPIEGFKLNDIQPKTCCKVIFCVQVIDDCYRGYIQNTAWITFTYRCRQEQFFLRGKICSNTVFTYVLQSMLRLYRPQVDVYKSKVIQVETRPRRTKENLIVVKQVNVEHATLNDELVHTVTLINEGMMKALKVNFREELLRETVFVQNSVVIDGIPKKGYNPYESFTLGTIQPNQKIQVVFKSKVQACPVQRFITNTTCITFAYYNEEAEKEIYKEVVSHPVTTSIYYQKLDIVQLADKKEAKVGERMTYSFVITNKGNTDFFQVMLVNMLQKEVLFKVGSLQINEKSTCYNPTYGVPLGSIPSMHTIKISFDVEVDENPSIGIVLNSAVLYFQYRLCPNGGMYTTSLISNGVLTWIDGDD